MLDDDEDLWPTEKVSLCLACSKHPEIRALVESDLAVGVCGVCGSSAHSVFNPAEFSTMRNLVRALIRFHFNEDSYNGHWGGTSVNTILLDELNPLIENATSTQYADDFIGRIEEEGGVYPDYDKGICLYAGSDDQGVRLVQWSIPETRSGALLDIERRLERENFHRVEPAVEALVSTIGADLDFHVDKGALWFRSRIGVEDRSLHIGWQKATRIAVPYKGPAIGALLPPSASAGRTNRQGVSVLYLASDVETALTEIRPHPGHLISIGGFRAVRDLRVANFDQPIGKFSASDKRLDDFALIYHIGSLLGEPVVPEERQRYAATQLLAEVLIRHGFDGVAFRSSMGPGKNLCVFDPADFAFDEAESRVKHVDELRYRFSNVAMSPPTD